jgi:hypothetical protein
LEVIAVALSIDRVNEIVDLVQRAHEGPGRADSALVRYADRRAVVVGLLAAVGELLEDHAARHVDRPTDWGLVGDLGSVGLTLAELVAGLAGLEG